MLDPLISGNAKSPCNVDKLEKVDLLLLTHEHKDHIGDTVVISNKFDCPVGIPVGLAEQLITDGLQEKNVLNKIGFNIGGTIEYQAFSVTMVEAFHTTNTVPAVGYIIRLPNNYTIYHSGDTGIFANMQIWGELYPIDLALLPIGGVFTMDERQAAFATTLLKAKKVIPMHWETFPSLAQNTKRFVSEMKKIAPNCEYILAELGKKIMLD